MRLYAKDNVICPRAGGQLAPSAKIMRTFIVSIALRRQRCQMFDGERVIFCASTNVIPYVYRTK